MRRTGVWQGYVLALLLISSAHAAPIDFGKAELAAAWAERKLPAREISVSKYEVTFLHPDRTSRTETQESGSDVLTVRFPNGDWTVSGLALEGGPTFTIHGEHISARFDLLYYFEVLNREGTGWFFPDPATATPYLVVETR